MKWNFLRVLISSLMHGYVKAKVSPWILTVSALPALELQIGATSPRILVDPGNKISYLMLAQKALFH